jgi:hypothetical protein
VSPLGAVATSPPSQFTTGWLCDSIDFNNDAVFPDLADVVDFTDVFGGGACGP